jgi:hypothetical protein
MKRLLLLTASLLTAVLVSGCEYRFAPGGEHIDKNIQKVYVDNFSNMTSEANVENYLRGVLIDQFMRGGRFKPVHRKEASDAVLSGKITGISTTHVSYERNDRASEDSVSMIIEAIFKETGGDKIIWTQKSLSGREAYKISNDPGITSKSRKEALIKLSNDIAEKTYREIMSGF